MMMLGQIWLSAAAVERAPGIWGLTSYGRNPARQFRITRIGDDVAVPAGVGPRRLPAERDMVCGVQIISSAINDSMPLIYQKRRTP